MSGDQSVLSPAVSTMPSKSKRNRIRVSQLKAPQLCFYCGSVNKLTVDHATPKVRGGHATDKTNLVVACYRCNHKKSILTAEEYFEVINDDSARKKKIRQVMNELVLSGRIQEKREVPRLIMTIGIPASGKSTWAKQQVLERRIKRVNKDDLRAMIDCGVWSPHNEKLIVKVRDNVVENALSKGLTIVVDDTNLVERHERRLRQLAEKYNAVFEPVVFDVDPLICIERDAKREHPVGAEVIVKMHTLMVERGLSAHPLLHFKDK